MKRPRKRNPQKVAEQGWSFNEQVGYNQACEDWMGFLPNENEIEEIIRQNGEYKKEFAGGLQDMVVIYVKPLAKAIHERLRGER